LQPGLDKNHNRQSSFHRPAFTMASTLIRKRVGNAFFQLREAEQVAGAKYGSGSDWSGG
jgi:hypothetical protein